MNIRFDVNEAITRALENSAETSAQSTEKEDEMNTKNTKAETIICTECGAIIEDAEAARYHGQRPFCETCYDERFGVCEICGDVIDTRRERYHYLQDGGMVCGWCADHDCARCEDCGELVPDYNTVEIDARINGGWESFTVCESCADDNYFFCSGCGQYVTAAHYDAETQRCTECYSGPHYIGPYHCGNPNGNVFKGEPTFSFIPAYIGMEVELTYGEGRGDATPAQHRHAGNVLATAAAEFGDADDLDTGFDTLHFEEDCSVTGYECIFQARTIEYWHQHAAEYSEIFRAMSADGACGDCGNGLHVHFSKSAFGADTDEIAAAVARFMLLFTGSNYDAMVKLSGRDRGNAERWADDMRSRASNADARKAIVRGTADDHNVSINTNRYKATVEIRLGQSTTDFDDVLGWVDLLAVAVNRSRTITEGEALDFWQWFKDAPEAVKQYMKRRGIDWKPPFEVNAVRVREILARAVECTAAAAAHTTGTTPRAEEILRHWYLTDDEIEALAL